MFASLGTTQSPRRGSILVRSGIWPISRDGNGSWAVGWSDRDKEECRACVDQRLSTLLPQLADVEVERIDQAADLVQIMARTRANQATCPSCGVPSGRTHSRYQRRTPGLTAMLEAIAVALAGRAGGREAAPLAEWLTRHLGVEVICRARSGSYAEGARLGAPDAVQVADRFHLWQNLAKATERCVARHRDCLRPPAPEQPEQPTAPAPAEEAPPVGRFAERARRHHALVHGLLAQGHGLRAIARHLGWGRHTVQRY